MALIIPVIHRHDVTLVELVISLAEGITGAGAPSNPGEAAGSSVRYAQSRVVPGGAAKNICLCDGHLSSWGLRSRASSLLMDGRTLAPRSTRGGGRSKCRFV